MTREIKGALDKYNIIPQYFPKKVEICIPFEVLAWAMYAEFYDLDWFTFEEIYEYFLHFLFFKVNFNKYTIQ